MYRASCHNQPKGRIPLSMFQEICYGSCVRNLKNHVSIKCKYGTNEIREGFMLFFSIKALGKALESNNCSHGNQQSNASMKAVMVGSQSSEQ